MSVSTPPSHRCPTCRSASVNARNLAVFIDGTSDKHGDKETNVMKLFNALPDEERLELTQRKQYYKGIGARDVDNLENKVDKAIAWNVKRNVIDAYKWLAGVYQEGDQIYLFGYSRGAYQVRALTSMIHEVGLVKENPTPEERFKEVYRLYCSIDPNKLETRNAAIKFKRTFCRPSVRIHFVGVWDTVSSLGLIKKDIHLTSSACVTNACHFRHALALDERRVKFMAEYFTEMNPHHTNVQSSRPAVGDVKEVWFAGCHSDVGGTSRAVAAEVLDPPEKLVPVHAGNVPLLWMRREAEAEGLVFESERFAWHPEDVDLGRKDTMNHAWKFFEILPIRHQISFSGTGKHQRR
ncbi:hypothetical protein HD554DRAFT_619999 [Boletus coccyginus]|nr:hypothetical protein HD554DRAFT_619999 [Boletus coccyginus]